MFYLTANSRGLSIWAQWKYCPPVPDSCGRNSLFDFRLLFHQYFYPAWQVTIDGERAAVEPAGRLSLVSVKVPSGSHELVLYWGATRAVWIGRTLTALGWLVVFLLIIFPVVSRRRGKGAETTASPPYRDSLPAAAWLVFGAVIVVVSSGMTSRTWNVTPVEANYGSILLEAVRDPPPTHAGEVAPVQLYWMVTGAPTPVKAFVHFRRNGLERNTGRRESRGGLHPFSAMGNRPAPHFDAQVYCS